MRRERVCLFFLLAAMCRVRGEILCVCPGCVGGFTHDLNVIVRVANFGEKSRALLVVRCQNMLQEFLFE